MTDYYDDDPRPDPVWVYIVHYDRNHPLTRFIFGVVLLALTGWFLIHLITT